MNLEDLFFNLGVNIAASAHNKTASDVVTIAAMADSLDDVKSANYGRMQRMTCQLAAEAFDEAGRKNELLYHVFNKLASVAVWHPEMDAFSDAVFRALGTIADQQAKEAQVAYKEDVVKSARTLLPSLVTTAGESMPDIIKRMAAVGALGGGVTGGLYWLLNRHSNEDEDKAEAVKAKIDYYNRLTGEIKGQLKNHPGNSVSDIKKVVQDSII